MIPGVFPRFYVQAREAALVWGTWSVASGVPTKLSGHNNLTLTGGGSGATGAYSLGFRGGGRSFQLACLPFVAPATPGTVANHRYVVPVDSVETNESTPAITFQTWRNATDTVAASIQDPQDGSVITVFALIAK